MKRIAVSAGVVVALLAVAAFAVGGAGATTQADNETGNDDPFGAEISSFMQASSAEAEGEVDDGMFSAALARTDDPEERRSLIERRQQRLQERQNRLQERRAQIDTGDGPDVKDRALAAHVTVGAASLERSVNGTERAAQAAGIDTQALDEIRTNARDLRGPAVADLARNISGQGQSPANPGPPIEVPGDGQQGSGATDANRSNGRSPGDVGPDDDAGNGSGDGEAGDQAGDGQSDDAGPPEDDPGSERGNAAGGSGGSGS